MILSIISKAQSKIEDDVYYRNNPIKKDTITKIVYVEKPVYQDPVIIETPVYYNNWCYNRRYVNYWSYPTYHYNYGGNRYGNCHYGRRH